MDALIDAVQAFGLNDARTLSLRDTRVALDRLWWSCQHEMQECDGDESIAHPLDDRGFVA